MAKNNNRMRTKKCTSPNCKRLGEELPLTDFHRRISNKDGLETRCKECIRKVNEKNAVRYNYQDKESAFESIFIGSEVKYYWLSD